MEEEFSGFPDSSDIHEQVQLHYELAISDLESDISQLETESSKCQVLSGDFIRCSVYRPRGIF